MRVDGLAEAHASGACLLHWGALPALVEDDVVEEQEVVQLQAMDRLGGAARWNEPPSNNIR